MKGELELLREIEIRLRSYFRVKKTWDDQLVQLINLKGALIELDKLRLPDSKRDMMEGKHLTMLKK